YIKGLDGQQKEDILLKSPMPFMIERTEELIVSSRELVLNVIEELKSRISMFKEKPLIGADNLQSSSEITSRLIQQLEQIIQSENMLVSSIERRKLITELIPLTRLVGQTTDVGSSIKSAGHRSLSVIKSVVEMVHIIAMNNAAMSAKDIMGLAERLDPLSRQFKSTLQELKKARDLILELRNQGYADEQIEMATKNVGYERISDEYGDSYERLLELLNIFIGRCDYIIRPYHDPLKKAYDEVQYVCDFQMVSGDTGNSMPGLKKTIDEMSSAEIVRQAEEIMRATEIEDLEEK
ncbi:MAG: hypothetical protein J7L96_04470, partial [Bacteroidales bacterium]|nr:hypothetical protein [Bacteroidales bacterium]